MFNSATAHWAVVLGFALGGFFDGILLHQILQWHHLLSLVPTVDSIRLQVLWDGYFHALMYLVAVFGLWGLWRNRADENGGQGAALLGGILIGFGFWHVVDSVLSHWTLGIHRIKLDSPNPLMWDLIWFSAFGALPLLLGWMMMLRRRRSTEGLSRSTLSLAVVGLLTTGAGFWAAQPPKNQPFTTVVFSPSVTPQDAMEAVVSEDAGLVWSDPAMGVLVVAVPNERRFNFYKHGALMVSGAGTGAGLLQLERCLTANVRNGSKADLHALEGLGRYEVAMAVKLTSAIVASAFIGQSVGSGAEDRLECYLRSQSWVCREEICAFGSTLHQGQTHRLVVDVAKGTLDLNGIPGTIDNRQVPAVVYWRLAILGQHTFSRQVAQGRTFVTLSSSSRSATFACSPER